MSSIRLILASLVYHWRMHVAVGCGVAAGTAVLTGALLVGDSMRGSLRDLTLDRLGRIDEVLVADRFFRAKLAEELAASPGFGEHFAAAVLLRASLENPDPDAPARANQINLLGCDRRFWELGPGAPAELPGSREVFLNRPLGDELQVGVGDRVILRLPRITTVPADTPLGRKSETVSGHRVTVSAIIGAGGLGRFSLRPTQHLPLNAYVPVDWLQERLEQADRVNAILVAGKDAGTAASPESEGVLQSLLEPSLADYGFRLEEIRLEETDRGYVNVTSDRMILEPAAEEAILESFHAEDVQPALTYLANTIACGSREIPYSTITAIDFDVEPPLGPLVTAEGKPIPTPGNGEIVLNAWAAEDLQASPGDVIRVTYFEPESVDAEVRERTEEFRLAAVAALAGAADDPALTPEVPGVTDRLSMADWNPPFPFDAKRIRDKDEQYWEDHRGTPKAFVSLATGRDLWRSRFGRTTSLRVRAAEGITAGSLQARLSLDPARLGLVFEPVKRQGLAASDGTTPFNLLFLGFSMFIIAAAVILVALLFRLGIDGRASQVGILLAVGLRRRQITRLFAGEGLAVAAVGSLLGVAAGVGYAVLMLIGLETLWLEAVVTPFLRLHVDNLWSLAIGYTSGVTVAFAAIVWSVGRTSRIAPQRLLAGLIDEEGPLAGGGSRRAGKLAWLLLGAAVLFGFAAACIGEAIRAGAFFGAGAMVLAACLAMVWTRLQSGATGAAVAPGRGNLLRMALRNAARNPARSTLTIALVAAACFLIVSVSAFRLDPTTQFPTRASGNGGFALVGESAQPIYRDFNTPSGRAELGFSPDDGKLLDETTTYALRVKPGDDASCLNLYKPRQPRMLGVPGEFIDRGGFVFTASKPNPEGERANPWLLLKPAAGGDVHPRVPVVLDDATAKYSLHLGLGQGLDVTNSRGRTVHLEIVGLLKTSIFQGDVLMSEGALLEHFPETSGYRFFLVESPPGETTDRVQNVLQRTLGDYGFAAETAGKRLAGFLAVQNTYLSTFQSLGGLGLLLGTLGLAAVELRNVLERRRELALLRAAGFRRGMLAWLVMLENGLLLVAGLAAGVVAAAVAVLPHLFGGGASIPWGSLAGTLALVLAVGVTAGLAAVRAVLRTPLLAALRQE